MMIKAMSKKYWLSPLLGLLIIVNSLALPTVASATTFIKSVCTNDFSECGVTFSLKNYKSGLCLAVESNVDEDIRNVGASIIQWPCNNTSGQTWLMFQNTALGSLGSTGASAGDVFR